MGACFVNVMSELISKSYIYFMRVNIHVHITQYIYIYIYICILHMICYIYQNRYLQYSVKVYITRMSAHVNVYYIHSPWSHRCRGGTYYIYYIYTHHGPIDVEVGPRVR